MTPPDPPTIHIPQERLTELPAPRGVAVRSECKRFYTTPCGRLKGVTTVLGATSAGKERLEAWKKRPDAEAISEQARNRGTWLHQQVEDWITAHGRGEPLPDRRHFAFGGYWRNMRPWLAAHWQQAVALEQAVYHPSGYAGSFDALGYCDYGRQPDALTLFDWKTSRNRRDDQLVEDYRCQLAAYAKAIEYVYGVRPERALLVIARPAGEEPDVWEYDRDELRDATREFGRRLQAFYELPS